MHKFSIVLMLALILAAPTSAQELPAEVAEAVSAYESFSALEDWENAANWAFIAAQAGEAARLPAAERAELWEAAGMARAHSGEFLPARVQLSSSLERWREANDILGQARTLRHLIELDLVVQAPSLALERLEAFEALATEHSGRFDQFERDVLSLVLLKIVPRRGRAYTALTPDETRRLERLDVLALEGSAGDQVVRFRRVIELIVSEDWNAALDEIVAALRLRQIGDADPHRVEERLFYFYNVILMNGFDDRDTDGTSRLPEYLVERWCAYISTYPPVVLQDLPEFPVLAQQDVDIEVRYTIGSNGEIGVIEITGNDNRTARREAARLEEAISGWRWRPQCNASADFRVERTVSLRIAEGRGRELGFGSARTLSMRGHLFYGAW
ncbi:MAG: hypothetical protein CMF74_01055 [Maricaulis sp.]|jgi:hypothetical protein|nr:hypothetical protein [Maricaulis sp.]